MSYTIFFNFALNAVIILVLLLFSRESLRKLKNIVTILSNGAYSDCPFYKDQLENGRRWYDKSLAENNDKGGENL